jgi:hypothetical protein
MTPERIARLWVVETVAPLAARQDGEHFNSRRFPTDHVADGLPSGAAGR